MIRIDSSGFDEIERELEVMVEGLNITVLNEWAAKILDGVRARVPDDKKSLVELRFSEKKGNKFDIDFRAPSEFIGYVKEEIEEHLGQMPITTQQVFQALLDQVSAESEK